MSAAAPELQPPEKQTATIPLNEQRALAIQGNENHPIAPDLVPVCKHPDRAIYARGMCGPCYQSARLHGTFVAGNLRKNGVQRIRIKQVTKCGHPDRVHYAKALCQQCYQKQRRTGTSSIHKGLFKAGISHKPSNQATNANPPMWSVSVHPTAVELTRIVATAPDKYNKDIHSSDVLEMVIPTCPPTLHHSFLLNGLNQLNQPHDQKQTSPAVSSLVMELSKFPQPTQNPSSRLMPPTGPHPQPQPSDDLNSTRPAPSASQNMSRLLHLAETLSSDQSHQPVHRPGQIEHLQQQSGFSCHDHSHRHKRFRKADNTSPTNHQRFHRAPVQARTQAFDPKQFLMTTPPGNHNKHIFNNSGGAPGALPDDCTPDFLKTAFEHVSTADSPMGLWRWGSDVHTDNNQVAAHVTHDADAFEEFLV